MTRSSVFRSPMPLLTWPLYKESAIVRCPKRTLARQFLDALTRQLSWSSGPRTSDPQLADLSANERTRALEPNVGTLLYIISLGIVAIATVLVFFGLSFFLLAHPNDELIAGSDARDRGVEIEHQSFDPIPSPDRNGALSTTQTASASPSPSARVPEPHYDVLPLATEDTAPGSVSAADTWAANSISDASSSQDQPGLRANRHQAAAAAPAGITNPKRTGAGRHQHVGARGHSAGTSRLGANRPPPPAISGPERAWYWIVQSATDILAALSPPPPRPARGLKTHWRADYELIRGSIQR